MFKKKYKTPQPITFTCRRCHVTLVNTKASRYCPKCTELVQNIKNVRQGIKK